MVASIAHIIRKNKKTSIFGVIAIVAETLRNNPSLVSFLSDDVRNYVLGIVAIICAVAAVLFTQDAKTEEETKEKVLTNDTITNKETIPQRKD